MIRLLEPWFENVSKRQVKSPKIYFRDSGILHTLLGIDTPELLHATPKVGASWEGFALEEVTRHLQFTASECFFWSTHAQAELDLFAMQKNKRRGFEIKYTDAPKITKSMRSALEDLKLDHLYIITPMGKLYQLDEKIMVVPLDKLDQLF